MKRTVILIVGVLILLCGVGGYFVTRVTRQAQQNASKEPEVKVERGEIVVKVVESGTIDAVKSVEVRSRASGRLKELLADEGSLVQSGQLIALIDPQETELRVRQDRAQLQGAASGVARTELEIRQQRITLQVALRQAEKRLASIKQELGIQPTMTRTAIEQARSALESAKKARSTLVEITQPNQRNEIMRAAADARVSFENAEREYRRQVDLAEKGYVAGRAAESAKLQLDLERTRLENARGTLGRLQQQQALELARADDDVRSAQAAFDRAMANSIQDDVKRRQYEESVLDVERARAALLQVPILQRSKEQSTATVTQLQSALEDTLRQLRETQVRAPFGGVISKRYIEVGDLVTGLSTFSAGTAIMRIEDRSKLRVKLEMNEIDVARITEGMPASIEIDALPGTKLGGRVNKIAPASTGIGQAQGGAGSSDAVVKYTVEVVLNEALPAIRTGMTAKCTLEVSKKPKALRVPIAYVGKDDKGSYVLVKTDPKNPAAKPERKEVKTGVTTGAYVEILSGVEEGALLARPPFSGPARQGMMSAGGPDEE